MPEIGSGILPCSKYNKLDNTLKQVVFAWIQGYMSALNRENSLSNHIYVDLGNFEFDNIAQEGLLKSLCLQNPDQPIFVQAISIMQRMTKMGLVVHSNP